MPDWVDKGFDSYARRLPQSLLRLKEIPLGNRGAGADVEKARRVEGERLVAAIPKNSTVVALECAPASWSTQKLVEKLKGWMLDGRDVALLVGGPDGLSAHSLQKAEIKWSLSALTLPHGLVRVVVAEQLYRAWATLNNHPYHRA
jgi:23S rRNA (pseudouridine1915-N3)-methyltransferase